MHVTRGSCEVLMRNHDSRENAVSGSMTGGMKETGDDGPVPRPQLHLGHRAHVQGQDQ
jgi:hypothetical protein